MKLCELSRLLPYHSHDPLILHWTVSRSSPVSSALLLQGKIWAQFITSEQSGCIQEALNQCWIVSSFCICFNKIPKARWHWEVYLAQILVAGESDTFTQLCYFILNIERHGISTCFLIIKRWRRGTLHSTHHPIVTTGYALLFRAFWDHVLPLRSQEWDTKLNLFPLGTLVNCKRI